MKNIKARHLFDGEQWRENVLMAISQEGRILSLDAATDSIETDYEFDWVIPGFANGHSHAFQRAMAGLAEVASPNRTDSFWTWRENMYGLVRDLDPKGFGAIANLLFCEALESGYTSIAEFHYVHHKPDGMPYDPLSMMSIKVAQAAVNAGIQLTLLPVLYRQGGFGKGLGISQKAFGFPSFEAWKDFTLHLKRELPPGTVLGAALHSVRAVNLPEIEAFASDENLKSMPLHIHVAEQVREVEECEEYYGMSPAKLLMQAGAAASNWTWIHGTHITEEEMVQMVNRRVILGLCPTTEANLGDGIPLLPEWLNLGGRMTIGSDSNIRLDPFEELRLLEYAQRLTRHRRICNLLKGVDSNGLSLARVCYSGAADSLGRPGIGQLRVGSSADFIVLDSDHPMLKHTNSEQAWDRIIFGGSREVIEHVFCRGQQVVKSRRHIRSEEIRRQWREWFKNRSGH